MKKTSSFLMAVALLLTMLVPMFAVGVVAEVPDGAVAYYVEGGETKYAYSLQDAFDVGGDANNTVEDIYLVENQTIKLTSVVVANAGKSFKLHGNGSTITEDEKTTIAAGPGQTALVIKGNSVNNVVTLENLTLELIKTSAYRNAGTLDIGTDTGEPVTAILKDVVITEKAGAYQTVTIRKDSKLILDSGTTVTNTMTGGIYGVPYTVLISASGSLEVKNGATIISDNSPAISTLANNAANIEATKASTIKISGGTLTSDANVGIDNQGEVTITNGKIEAKSARNAIQSNGKVTISGGEVVSNGSYGFYNLGTAIISGGTITSNGNVGLHVTDTGNATVTGGTITGTAAVEVVGSATISGGKMIATDLCSVISIKGGDVIINGGYFTTASENLTLNYRWGLVVAGNGSGHPGGKVTINGGDFYYPMADTAAGSDPNHTDRVGGPVICANASSDGKHEIAVNGGNFYGAKYIYNGDAHGHSRIHVDSFTNLEGASVRTVEDESGIRFMSTINAEQAAALVGLAKDGKVTYGTVIAPYDFVQQVDVFTMAALDAADIKHNGVSVAANKKYLNFVAENGIKTDDDGNVTVRAALVNLDESNFARDFAAIPYISYQTDNGTVIIYGDFDAEKNVRNMREIAYEALADVKTSIETDYATKVETWYEYENNEWVEKTGTAYSCYSNAQLTVIKAYLPKIASN